MSSALLVAHAIIDKHGGVVGVRSVLGEGSVFHFDLPIIEARQNIDSENRPRAESMDSSTRTRRDIDVDLSTRTARLGSLHFHHRKNSRHRALVVDDSQLNRKMVMKVVSKYFDIALQVS